MYQSQIRPDQGARELFARQQPKQHSRPSVHTNSSQALRSFRQSSLVKSKTLQTLTLGLASSWVVLSFSACGVTYRNLDTIQGSTGGTQTTTQLNKISCGTQSLTGVQSKACSVYLNGTAKSPTVVTLTSSNKALEVPTAVTVAAGSNSTGFDAVSSPVSQTTTVTITGKADSVSKTDVIVLYPEITSTSTLSKISCGTQTLTGPTTKLCSVYLSDPADSQVKVSLTSSSSALQVPQLLLIPAGVTRGGFTATAKAVATTEKVTLTASMNGVSQTEVMQLDGTGTGSQPTTAHSVELRWSAPSSTSVAIVGYRVYRATSGASYHLLNSTVDSETTYTDSSVQSGETYDYVVRSVDAEGTESGPSNETTITVP